MTRHLTTLKETLTNYVWENLTSKNSKNMKLSIDSGFSNVFYGKKRKPGNSGNQPKAF